MFIGVAGKMSLFPSLSSYNHHLRFDNITGKIQVSGRRKRTNLARFTQPEVVDKNE